MRQKNLTDDRIESLIREASTMFLPPADVKAMLRERLVRGDGTAHTQYDNEVGSAAEKSDAADDVHRRRLRLFAHPWRLASAASFLLLVGAFAAYVMWPTQLTLAQVREAVEQVEWVHLKFDNGEEQWFNIPRQITARIAPHPEFKVYIDYERGVRWGKFGGVDYIDKGEINSTWDMGTTVWDRIVGPVEERVDERELVADLPEDPKLAEYVKERRARHWTESHPDVIDERPVIRFDSYSIDVLGQELLMRQLWADPVNRLPVKERRRMQLGERDPQDPDQVYITARYEFPESGPESIYDLGVLRTVQIVEHVDVAPEIQAVEIVERMKAAAKAFPTRYRQVRWDKDALFVLYWDGAFDDAFRGMWFDLTGVRMHWRHYFAVQWERDETRQDESLLLPGELEEAVQWADANQPIGLRVADGIRLYSQRGPYPDYFSDSEVNVRVMDITPTGEPGFLASSQWIVDVLWPLADGHTGELIERIESPDGDSQDLIHLRYGNSRSRNDYYLDRRHDLICVRRVHSRFKDGEWIIERDERVEDLVPLPSGHWYGRTLRWFLTSQRNGASRTREVVHTVHINLLDEADLPDDMFDIDALLEKARELGATIETH